ncbi:hypothetical protein BN946_scf184907.g13 [Trametes cinnabarina]|uniref:Fungal-type protein kinase domain-containing protein n=1 Tax=Pycnoporus cinnabarinus TaxID=5643 RepID=A0A060SZN0_PYCCI|nr:hypothetical protein BN946_scf184907.g13 [Trametes cinnabarina]
MGQMHAINKANILGDFMLSSAETSSNNLDVDSASCAMCAKDSPVLRGVQICFDWASVEVLVVCRQAEDDPFGQDPGSRNTLDYLTRCASEAFDRQQRSHLFTVLVIGSFTRLGRWDRSGDVFSRKFDYKREHEKLSSFFWQVAHVSAEVRGHDPLATRILPGSEDHELLKAWQAKGSSQALADHDYIARRFIRTLTDSWPSWRLTVDDSNQGRRDFLVGMPICAQYGMIGQATRGYIALDVSDSQFRAGSRLVYLTDCWRVVDKRRGREGDILPYLNDKHVPNVPTLVCHGDLIGQRTLSQIWNTPTRRAAPEDEDDTSGMRTLQHYRVVVREIGVPLEEFPRGKILVAAVTDAIVAHRDAYALARVMHRNISLDNIVIVPNSNNGVIEGYQGLLIDWELSKPLDDRETDDSELHPSQAGTFPFMSVRALSQNELHTEIADELESFLLVLIYCAVLHLHNTCRDVREFIYDFFESAVHVEGSHYTASMLKQLTMQTGRLRTLDREDITILRSPNAPTLNESGATAAQSIPEEKLHPLQPVITNLLRLFNAHYQLLEEESEDTLENSRGSATTPPTALGSISRRWQHHLFNRPMKAIDLATRTWEEFVDVFAPQVRSYSTMLGFLRQSLNSKWPENDRTTPSRLSFEYTPRKTEVPGNKRSAPDESESQELPARKRGRCATSQP